MGNLQNFLVNLKVDSLLDELDINDLKTKLKDICTICLAGGSISDLIIYKYLLYEGYNPSKPYISDIDLFISYTKLGFLSNIYEEYVTSSDNNSEYGDSLIKKSFTKKGSLYNIIQMREELTPNNIIEDFDLNCCKTGIYFNRVNNKFELYISKDFINFLNNKSIKVVNTKGNIASTTLRLLKYYSKWGKYFSIDFYREYETIYRAINYTSKVITPDKVNYYSERYGSKILNNQYFKFEWFTDDLYILKFNDVFNELMY